jgi:hypothetical protein
MALIRWSMVTQADAALLALTGVLVLLTLIIDYHNVVRRKIAIGRLTVAELQDNPHTEGVGQAAPQAMSH